MVFCLQGYRQTIDVFVKEITLFCYRFRRGVIRLHLDSST